MSTYSEDISGAFIKRHMIKVGHLRLKQNKTVYKKTGSKYRFVYSMSLIAIVAFTERGRVNCLGKEY